MHNDILRLKQIITRDKMMDISKLTKIVSEQVSDRLSEFFYIEDCLSSIKVLDKNELEIVVALKAKGVKIV